jgi:radical SAM superfamily enzyme YgiQ (UPF0313 family)
MRGWGEFREKLAGSEPDVIGVSLASPLLKWGRRAVLEARSLWRGVPIVAGGPHATVAPEHTLTDVGADYTVIGEGEETFLELLQVLADQADVSTVRGIGYRRNGEVQLTPAREPIANLDAWPNADRSFIEYARYLHLTGSIVLLAQRGCPNDCVYCQPTQRKLFGRRIRSRTPEGFVAEMCELRDRWRPVYPRAKFYFEDDTFTFNRKWCLRVLDLMKQERLHRIPWWCNTRVDCLDRELVSAMREAGGEGVCLGVESGSQRILKNILHKQITPEQTREAFSLCHGYGLFTVAFVMIGSPTEGPEDLLETQRLLQNIRPDILQVSITTPIIGSRLYEETGVDGTRNTGGADEWNYCTNKYSIHLSKLTAEDLQTWRARLQATVSRSRWRNAPKYLNWAMRSPRRLWSRALANLIPHSSAEYLDSTQWERQ